MRRIAIASEALYSGDAVSNDAFEMQRVLAARGDEAVLFSSQRVMKCERSRDISALPAFLAGDPQAILVYHHCIGWKGGVELLRRTTCKRIIKYHNVTPSRFFESYSDDLARGCRLGREQLRDLAQIECQRYLCDSEYNRGEMIEAGVDAERCSVVPPFHHIDRLDRVQADPHLLRRLDDGGTNVLFVGRRVPHKGHRYLVDAFAIYHKHYDRSSRLLLVGRQEKAVLGYTFELRERALRQGVLERVLFVDEVTEAQLKAYYERAAVFVTASEHEGFCVPVVEAMALRVPIVAFGDTAVPLTVGDSGLVWDKPDPYLLAQSIAEVVRNAEVRRRLTERGWCRYRETFANDRIEHNFLREVDSLAA
jgi:glycosyltransferase involved in cell wall biosynthesis